MKAALQKLANLLGEEGEIDHLSEKKQDGSLDCDYLSDLLCYRLYDSERKLYDNQTSAGFVLEMIPDLSGSAETERELASLVQELKEDGAAIQCLLFADPRIDRFVQRWVKPRHDLGGIYSRIADKKQAFLLQELQEGGAPPRIFRFILSYSQPKPEKELAQFLNRLVEKKQKALETLSRINPSAEMDPDRFIELLSGFVNFNLSPVVEDRKAWDKHNFLSKQICRRGTAIEVDPDRIVFKEKGIEAHLRTYEAADVPTEWALPLTGELLGDFLNASYRIPTPFYLHYAIHFPSQQKVERKFWGKLKVLEHQSKFPYLSRICPSLPKEIDESLLARKRLLEGEVFVETRFSCGLFAKPEKLVQVESSLSALFQKYGFKLRDNQFLHLPDFLSSLPMAWGEDSASIAGLKRIRSMRTTLTRETALLMPCVGEWWGNSQAGAILMGRKGQIAAWDPFATEGNLNSVVVGPSGSGKSVFMQEMIMSHLGTGGRVFVLDLGRSFEKLCHLLGGQYLAFSERCGFDLNPFRLISASEGPEAVNAGLEMVANIAATMAMPLQKIDKERSDILSSLVKAAWMKEGNAATIDTMIELIGEMQFQSQLMIGAAESLKQGLRKFSRQGVYANYFYGSSPVDFTSNLVVIETEELKNMADLQAVMLQMFTLTISNQIFMGDRTKRCMICIDEAWDLLKSPQMEGFIETLARRLRKYNGALVVGTQSVKDFERSHGARAAFQNSNWLVMLGRDSDSLNALKKDNLIPMSEFRETALSSLRMERGKYSELFLYHKGSGASAVCQLKLDPFSALLYSTKADEFQAIQELKALGWPIEDALQWLLENKELLKQGQTIQQLLGR